MAHVLRRTAMPLNSRELEILAELESTPPAELLAQRLAANNQRIRDPQLDNGRDVAAERTAVHTALAVHWAAAEHRKSGYDRPFALVAIGGTGREEMTPCSDTDFALLCDDDLDGNEFINGLQRQLGVNGNFRSTYGFSCGALPFNLESIGDLEHRQLNSFIDMRPVYDPDGLSERFREALRQEYDPFQHFLHVHDAWREQGKNGKHNSERLDKFDIKMDGLRVFLAGIWARAGRDFSTSREIYASLGDSQDLEAYYFLLRIRAFIQGRRGTTKAALGGGMHDEDVLEFEDFTSFGEMLDPIESSERDRFEFANKVRARLLAARRRVARFTRGVMAHELDEGRRISPESTIYFGPAGLRQADEALNAGVKERSSSGLSLLLAAQSYELPVDPAALDTTFREAGDWLVRTPELAELFFEENGSLADSFEFLAQFAGAENRIFPGYGEFEVSIDERVMNDRQTLRGALVHQKIRTLEDWRREGRQQLDQQLLAQTGPVGAPQAPGRIPLETAMLDNVSMAAVKLALKTKRLPLTEDDVVVRRKENLELYDRFSSGFSGIPLKDYYAHSLAGSGFSEELLSLTEFLVENRRVFKVEAQRGPNDAVKVREFADLCGKESRLRALYVFTCADRFEWESEEKFPVLWFSIRELYSKVMSQYRPKIDPAAFLVAQGFDQEQIDVLRGFGPSLLGGGYGEIGIQFGERLARLALDEDPPGPRAKVVRKGASTILAVAARDSLGLAASISGALLEANVPVVRAHLFSALEFGVALNFFHITATRAQPLPAGLPEAIEDAIARKLHVGEDANPPREAVKIELIPWRSSGFRLTAKAPQDRANELIYALTYHVFRSLGGNVHGLTEKGSKGRAEVSVYHSLPDGMSLERANEVIASVFPTPDGAA